jgi:hypothetical protein
MVTDGARNRELLCWRQLPAIYWAELVVSSSRNFCRPPVISSYCSHFSLFQFCMILSRVGVTYKRGFGLDDWIYCTLYIHTTRDYRQYSAIAILTTSEFTAAHALGFSRSSLVVSWQRIYNSLTVTSNRT